MKLWFDFWYRKSREKKNCDTSQFLLKTLKKVSKHWGFLEFEDTLKSVKTLRVSWIWRSNKKNRHNECYKIKFINDKNQTHQSQTSKTEALQVNNFQSATFVYWPFYQRIWTKILHGSKGIFLSDSSM